MALEALACGCVPLVSDNTAMAEAVGEALRDEGTQVDVCRARKAKGGGPYQTAVVVASVAAAVIFSSQEDRTVYDPPFIRVRITREP